MSEGANVNVTSIQQFAAIRIQGGWLLARRVMRRVSMSRSAPAAVEAPQQPTYALQVCSYLYTV